MSDVINGVPLELLERVAKPVEAQYDRDQRWKALEELRALLTAQPQASAAQSAPDEREAYEQACHWRAEENGRVFESHYFKRSSADGHYLNPSAEHGWQVWQQARAAWQRAQSAPAGAVLVKIPEVRDLTNVGDDGAFVGHGWNRCIEEFHKLNQNAQTVDGLLNWAVDRWHAEVANRPLHNVHRRSLDDTWRQIIRRLGGDAGLLCGPAHDVLAAAHQPAARQEQGDDTARLDFMLQGHRKIVVERLPHDNFAVYVEEGFMGDKQYPAVKYSGRWEFDSPDELEIKREAIDAALSAQQMEGK